MPNKNSQRLLKRCYYVKWHDANFLAKTVSNIGMWPSIKYSKPKKISF